MTGPPQAVEASHNEDAKGKAKNYYFTLKFANGLPLSSAPLFLPCEPWYNSVGLCEPCQNYVGLYILYQLLQ